MARETPEQLTEAQGGLLMTVRAGHVIWSGSPPVYRCRFGRLDSAAMHELHEQRLFYLLGTGGCNLTDAGRRALEGERHA